MAFSHRVWSRLGFRFLVAVVLALAIAQTPVLGSRAAAGCVGTTHIAQPGDHLAGIARQYNVSVHQILYRGNPADPAQVTTGQVLCVGPAPAVFPVDTEPPAWPDGSAFLSPTRSTVGELPARLDSGPAASSTALAGVPDRCYEARFTVHPGDSVFRIAARYGVSAQAILARNRLPSATICVGQLLMIPVPDGC